MANSIEVLPVIEWRDPGPTQAQINAKAIASTKEQNALAGLFLGLCLLAPTLYGLGNTVYQQTVTSPSIEYRQ